MAMRSAGFSSREVRWLATLLEEHDRPPGAAHDLAKRLLKRYASIGALRDIDSGELAIAIGSRGSARIRAALELGRRVQTKPFVRGERIDSPTRAGERFQRRLENEQQEHFIALALDSRLHALGEFVIALGGLSEVQVRPREAFRPLLRVPAVAVIFVHNHPTGDPEPSEEDLTLTRRLVLAGEVLGIRVMDHLIVARGGCVSLRERGAIGSETAAASRMMIC